MVQSRLTALYNYDPSIFDGLTVPEGINKQTVIDTILLDCLPFETLFPQPEFLKMSIRIWSDSCQTVWNHLYETMNYDYNPIWNKDGSYTENRNTKGSSSSQAINSTKAFNTNNWMEHTKADASGTAESGEVVTRTEKGNIGVTTTQQMIKEERDIAEFNLIKYIAADFKNRFCIMVY